MLDTATIVQSAATSFNNAALFVPSFFWTALLSIPLFAIAYIYGNDFLSRIGWNPKSRALNFALAAEVAILAWLVLMPGNYIVLRDLSVLPFAVAAIIFMLSISIAGKLKDIDINLPEFMRRRGVRPLMWLALVIIVGFSGMPTIFGFLLQAAAFVCGVIVGFAIKKPRHTMTTLVIFALAATILMQPEFFRFGQVGNLTFIHMAAVLVAGGLSAAVFALYNVRASGRIDNAVYSRLKVLARILAGLFLVLFVLTESVLVFLGLMCILFASFVISVRHMESVPESLARKLWAILLVLFGAMTMMPIISAIGVVYLASLPGGNVWKQIKFLL